MTFQWSPPTNAERAQWAHMALGAHVEVTGSADVEAFMVGDILANRLALINLLSDLMHWADEHGVDWWLAARDAGYMYTADKQEAQVKGANTEWQ